MRRPNAERPFITTLALFTDRMHDALGPGGLLRPFLASLVLALAPLTLRALMVGGLLGAALYVGLPLLRPSPALRAGEPPGVERVYNLVRAEETAAETEARRKREDAQIAERRKREDAERKDARAAADSDKPVDSKETPPGRPEKKYGPGGSMGATPLSSVTSAVASGKAVLS